MNLVWSVALLLATTAWSVHLQETADATTTMASSPVSVPPSPECWKKAVVGALQLDPLSEHVCHHLGEDQLKYFVFLITHCHLHDFGRPLIQDRKLLGQCLTAETDIKQCLLHLTPAGEHTYTQYKVHVQQVCLRSTQEAMMEMQRAQQLELQRQYANLAVSSVEKLTYLGDMAEQHAENLSALALIPGQVGEQLNHDLRVSIEETVSNSLGEQIERHLQIQLQEQLQGRIERLLETQAALQKSLVDSLYQHLQARETDRELQYEEWRQSQSQRWLAQWDMLQSQVDDQLAKHRARLDDLSSTVSATKSSMQPLLSLQSLIATATVGYSWLAFLLHFLTTLNVVWLATRPDRCRRFRAYLFGIVMAEALVELLLATLVAYDMVTDTERMELLLTLRRGALVLEGGCYILGLILSLFGVPDEPKTVDEKQEAILRRLEELAKKSMAEATARQHAPEEPVAGNVAEHRVQAVATDHQPGHDQPYVHHHHGMSTAFYTGATNTQGYVDQTPPPPGVEFYGAPLRLVPRHSSVSGWSGHREDHNHSAIRPIPTTAWLQPHYHAHQEMHWGARHNQIMQPTSPVQNGYNPAPVLPRWNSAPPDDTTQAHSMPSTAYTTPSPLVSTTATSTTDIGALEVPGKRSADDDPQDEPEAKRRREGEAA